MTIPLSARLAILAPLIVLGVLIDQLSKLWAISALQGGPRFSFLFDTLRLTYAENTGAFLGLGTSLPPHLRFIIFTALVGVFLLALLVYLLRSKELDRLSLAALGLVFVGGFSNFIDRARNEGAVVDFLNMGFGGLRTGIFNLADVYIMVGAGLLLFGHWWLDRHKAG
ncbi:signal peptidase II [Reinekea sp.]|jgi:signal peptidase II|uniref:signal peptidase II n=1 Tax=Reinekea sp. TaxID=1970455 RepID=UPI002A81D0BD|nr:signal peptidase II [Reinekea sp.]